MTVYVDRMRMTRYGLTFTAHMMADTPEELDDMADQVGLKREWKQLAGTHREHYDLTEGRRRQAIRLGAVEVTSRGLVSGMNARKENSDAEG